MGGEDTSGQYYVAKNGYLKFGVSSGYLLLDNDWDRFTQQQVQDALLKKITPREALTNSANKASQLKKEWR